MNPLERGKMELYKRLAQNGIPDIVIDREEWKREYENIYDILAIHASEAALISAAEAIIAVYLLLQKEKQAK